jgi:hypothetical protein
MSGVIAGSLVGQEGFSHGRFDYRNNIARQVRILLVAAN